MRIKQPFRHGTEASFGCRATSPYTGEAIIRQRATEERREGMENARRVPCVLRLRFTFVFCVCVCVCVYVLRSAFAFAFAFAFCVCVLRFAFVFCIYVAFAFCLRAGYGLPEA